MIEIEPSAGRVVLFWPRHDDNIGKFPGQPLAALIVGVPPYKPGKVNLTVFGARGGTYAYENIPLVQPQQAKPKDGDWCEWPGNVVLAAIRRHDDWDSIPIPPPS